MTTLTIFIRLACVAALFASAQSIFLPKRDGFNYLARESILDPKKRPFCNAFTGCGRKRSNLPPMPAEPQQPTKQHRVIDESLGSLLELNSEPGVEDLTRQILSEAKLWEAIQEANVELKRVQESFDNDEDVHTGN